MQTFRTVLIVLAAIFAILIFGSVCFQITGMSAAFDPNEDIKVEGLFGNGDDTTHPGKCSINGNDYSVTYDTQQGRYSLDNFGAAEAIRNYGGTCTVVANSAVTADVYNSMGQMQIDGANKANGSPVRYTGKTFHFVYDSGNVNNGFAILEVRNASNDGLSQAQSTSTATSNAILQPNQSFCRLGVTTNNQNGVTHSLNWDSVQQRGYMNDVLAVEIQQGPAYCRTTFNDIVTILFDAIATTNPGGKVFVDGIEVKGGNGIIVTGKDFVWIYPSAAVSNGHAFIIQ